MRADVDIWGWVPDFQQAEEDPTETNSSRGSRLKVLMREREDLVGRLMEIDFAIWVLEESFRAGS